MHHLGLILHQKGESKRGITLIEKALSIKPDYEYALNNIGKIYLDLGNWDIAAINFKKAIIEPVNVIAPIAAPKDISIRLAILISPGFPKLKTSGFK